MYSVALALWKFREGLAFLNGEAFFLAFILGIIIFRLSIDVMQGLNAKRVRWLSNALFSISTPMFLIVVGLIVGIIFASA